MVADLRAGPPGPVREADRHQRIPLLAPGTEETTADRDALWSELAALPRQQRVVLVLRFYEGLSDAEIAEIMGCRPATVRGYASGALSTLRIELAEWRAPLTEDRP